jgi:peptide/nickel transport system permease protein
MKGLFRYAMRRLGFYLLAAWGAITLNFFLPRMMPGDPASTLFGRFKGRLDPSAIERLQELLGYGEGNIFSQYIDYLQSLFHGELGISIAYFPQPVSEVIQSGMAWTLLLAGTAAFLAFLIGSTLGALSAWNRGGKLDDWAPAIFALIGAFPYFWLAMLASYVFAFQLEWFPIRHAYGANVEPGWNWAFIDSVISHLFLPALTMVLASLSGWMLMMRSTMIQVLGQKSIRYARARGISERRVFLNYAVKNAILPSLTSFGMALGFVVSGALLTEIIFAYPGEGYLLIQAVQAQDYPLLQGLFLAITLSVLLANFIVDLLTAIFDPRTRS